MSKLERRIVTTLLAVSALLFHIIAINAISEYLHLRWGWFMVMYFSGISTFQYLNNLIKRK